MVSKAKTDSAVNMRDKILQAAANLFTEQGYASTSLNDVLKLCSAPKGSFYYYFPEGKEQLVREAVQTRTNEIADILRSIIYETDDICLDFENVIQRLIDRFEENPARKARSATILAKEISLLGPQFSQLSKDVILTIRTIFQDRMKIAGISEEKAEELSFLCMNTIEGALLSADILQDPKPLRVIKENIHIYFDRL